MKDDIMNKKEKSKTMFKVFAFTNPDRMESELNLFSESNP